MGRKVIVAETAGEDKMSVTVNGTNLEVCVSLFSLIQTVRRDMPEVTEALNLKEWEPRLDLMPVEIKSKLSAIWTPKKK
jgi:phage baseplate assembly protein W